MGIRCYCPNGHKLNLKSFLAGKKGICPECGAKFRIPFADSDEPAIGLPELSSANRSKTASGLPDFDFSFPDPQRTQAAQSGGGGAGKSESVAAAFSSPAGLPHEPAPQPAVSSEGPLASHAPIDPLREKPDAVWYVRTPTGEQYGPAKGPVMRTWLDEGRITKDSYVWREGWPDWRLGSDVWGPFPTPVPTTRPAQTPWSGSARPQSGSGGPSGPSGPLQFSRPAAVGRSPSARTATARSYSSRNATLTFVILLAFVCIVLLAALVWVVQSGQ